MKEEERENSVVLKMKPNDKKWHVEYRDGKDGNYKGRKVKEK